MRLLGAILAGGRATRFGSDKALAPLHGQPLIAHAAAAIAPVVDATLLCGRRDALLGLDGVPDWPEPHLGPLGGLCGALRHAAANGFDAVLSIGCDVPALPTGLAARLAAADRACFVSQAPVIGRWPANLFATLEDRLRGGADRSVLHWAKAIGADAIDAGGDLPNVNRADDLRAYAASRIDTISS